MDYSNVWIFQFLQMEDCEKMLWLDLWLVGICGLHGESQVALIQAGKGHGSSSCRYGSDAGSWP
jgi:hypothetical protein